MPIFSHAGLESHSVRTTVVIPTEHSARCATLTLAIFRRNPGRLQAGLCTRTGLERSLSGRSGPVAFCVI
jgi:hypothetical protein